MQICHGSGAFSGKLGSEGVASKSLIRLCFYSLSDPTNELVHCYLFSQSFSHPPFCFKSFVMLTNFVNFCLKA